MLVADAGGPADPRGGVRLDGQLSPSSDDTFYEDGYIGYPLFLLDQPGLGDQFFHAAQGAVREAEMSTLYNM